MPEYGTLAPRRRCLSFAHPYAGFVNRRIPKERVTMVGGICTKPAITASPDTTIREAAHRMRSRKVGALVVINGSGTPVGVLTDRDITVKVVAQGADPSSTRVGALVTRKPTVIREDAGILDATKLLSR